MASSAPRPYATTPTAIIEAAERLFGSQGIEAVSTRQVMIEAKVGNKSAVAYHFGSRAELVNAIWMQRLPRLDARRRVMLGQLREAGRERDAHAVMRVLVQPNYELRDAQGVHRYAAFFRHALRWREGRDLRLQAMGRTPASQETIDLIAALAPDVPAELLSHRLRYSCCAFFDMVFDRDCDLAEGHPVVPEDQFLAEGVDMLVAACLRPPPPEYLS